MRGSLRMQVFCQLHATMNGMPSLTEPFDSSVTIAIMARSTLLFQARAARKYRSPLQNHTGRRKRALSNRHDQSHRSRIQSGRRDVHHQPLRRNGLSVTPFKEAEELPAISASPPASLSIQKGGCFVGDRSGTIYLVNEIGEGTSFATLERAWLLTIWRSGRTVIYM